MNQFLRFPQKSSLKYKSKFVVQTGKKQKLKWMFAYREQLVHQRKMGQIASSNKAIREAKEISNMLKKNREDRKKTKDFLTNEKNITINKDNQILLNKLVEISSGKWSSIAAPLPNPQQKKNRN